MADLQCSMKFTCKFTTWHLDQVDKLTSKKYVKTINLLCAGNKVFVKFQAQGGLPQTPPQLPTALADTQLLNLFSILTLLSGTVSNKA